MYRRKPKKHKGDDLGSRRCSCFICRNHFGKHEPKRKRGYESYRAQLKDYFNGE